MGEKTIINRVVSRLKKEPTLGDNPPEIPSPSFVIKYWPFLVGFASAVAAYEKLEIGFEELKASNVRIENRIDRLETKMDRSHP